MLFLLAGCGGGGSAKTATYEAKGNSAERVAVVSRILGKRVALPTSVLDAQFVEEQTGDGRLGPSDFESFYWVKVPPAEIGEWTKLLTPVEGVPEYAGPSGGREWWVSKERFGLLRFYKAQPLTGRLHGWAGVLEETGEIYIYSFTM